MTTNSSDLALTVTAPRRGAGKEAFAHLSRDESQAMIQPLIFELSVKISRRAALLEASSSDPAQISDDLAALAWIQRSLEDIEATIVGLSEANRLRSAASQGPAPSSAETWSPRFRLGQPAASIKAPLDHPGGLPILPSTPGHLACPKY